MKSADFRIQSGAKVYKFCRSRKMQKNDYLLAKFGVDTAENEPLRARLRARLNIGTKITLLEKPGWKQGDNIVTA